MSFLSQVADGVSIREQERASADPASNTSLLISDTRVTFWGGRVVRLYGVETPLYGVVQKAISLIQEDAWGGGLLDLSLGSRAERLDAVHRLQAMYLDTDKLLKSSRFAWLCSKVRELCSRIFRMRTVDQVKADLVSHEKRLRTFSEGQLRYYFALVGDIQLSRFVEVRNVHREGILYVVQSETIQTEQQSRQRWHSSIPL